MVFVVHTEWMMSYSNRWTCGTHAHIRKWDSKNKKTESRQGRWHRPFSRWPLKKVRSRSYVEFQPEWNGTIGHQCAVIHRIDPYGRIVQLGTLPLSIRLCLGNNESQNLKNLALLLGGSMYQYYHISRMAHLNECVVGGGRTW